MQKVLEQLNTVPEVIGSMVCEESGTLKAHIFPAIFDEGILQKACETFTSGRLWFGSVNGETGLMDLRFSDGRIIARTLQGGVLFVLCTKAVNLQLLNISLNVAKNRIEELMPVVPIRVLSPPPKSTPVEAPTPPPRAEGPEEGRLLTVDELDATSEAGRGFQELGMAALSATTAQRLCGIFQVGAIKKLKLTMQAGDTSGVFGIVTFNDDTGRYDGKIILSRQVEKKLQAGKGDVIRIDPA